jgi:hypothetical protein
MSPVTPSTHVRWPCTFFIGREHFRDRFWLDNENACSRGVATVHDPAERREMPVSMHPRVEQLRRDEAIAEADTLLLPLPNQLGVA